MVSKKVKSPMTLKKKMFLFMILVSVPGVILLGTISFLQEKRTLNNANQELANTITNNLNNQLDKKIQTGNAVLDSIAFNSEFGRNFDNFSQNDNLYEMYTYLTDSFDPSLRLLTATNLSLKGILFFTDSKLNISREMIHPLEDAVDYPFHSYMRYLSVHHWFLSDEYVYAIGQIPKTVANETFTVIVLQYYRDKFFSDLEYPENTTFAEITGDFSDPLASKSQPTHLLGKKIPGSKEITNMRLPSVHWNFNIYQKKRAISTIHYFGKTIVGVLLSMLLSAILSSIFTRSISENFRKLEHKIHSFVNKKEKPEFFITSQKDDFGRLSNSVAEMLQKLDETQEKIHLIELENEKSKYDALVNQINSHFLYNTLSMINWKAIELGNVEISQAVQDLSKFYRTTLNSGKSISNLSKELENVKAYLDLQLMLNPNFTVDYDVDQSILETDTINLMLQPIVENAIEHGFVKVKKSWHLFISVQLYLDKYVKIEIRDNGIGMTDQAVYDALHESGKGYGLKNLNQRIKFFFCEEYGLSIKSQINEGTIVTLLIPNEFQREIKND